MVCLRNDRHYSPLVYACYTNQLECFKVIFEHGLEYASDTRSVSELVVQWLGPEQAQTECLSFAIQHSNEKLLCYLLDALKLNPDLAAQLSLSPFAEIYETAMVSISSAI